MKNFVYCTLTNDHAYTNFKPQDNPGQPLEIESQVIIKGGANLATSQLITPLGARTEVSDDQLEALEKNSTFQKHKSQGFIKVTHHKEDADEAVHDMQAKDAAAPKTPDSPEFQGSGEMAVKPMKKGKK